MADKELVIVLLTKKADKNVGHFLLLLRLSIVRVTEVTG